MPHTVGSATRPRRIWYPAMSYSRAVNIPSAMADGVCCDCISPSVSRESSTATSDTSGVCSDRAPILFFRILFFGACRRRTPGTTTDPYGGTQNNFLVSPSASAQAVGIFRPGTSLTLRDSAQAVGIPRDMCEKRSKLGLIAPRRRQDFRQPVRHLRLHVCIFIGYHQCHVCASCRHRRCQVHTSIHM